MKKKKSKILKTVHKSIQGLHEAGIVDNFTMREFDSLCLPETPAKQTTGINKV